MFIQEENSVIIELYDEMGLIKTIEIKGIKHVFNDSVFGFANWSQDNSKICFISQPEEENKLSKGLFDESNEGVEKFDFKHDFGENYDGLSTPVLTILDIESECFKVLNLLEFQNFKDYIPAYPVFSDCQSIAFTGYHLKIPQGLLYMLNRKTDIFKLTDIWTEQI